MAELRTELVKLEKDYSYPDYYNKDSDPVFRAVDNAAHILLFDERVPKYLEEEQLNERLAFLISEVPESILKMFLRELYDYIAEVSNEVKISYQQMPALNTTGRLENDYSYELRHDTYIAWSNKGTWQLNESDYLIGIAHDIYTNKKDLYYPHTIHGLQQLLQSNILAAKEQESCKAQAEVI